MHAYATQMLKKENDFTANGTGLQEHAGAAWAIRLVAVQSGVAELFPKELLCCSLATD